MGRSSMFPLYGCCQPQYSFNQEVISAVESSLKRYFTDNLVQFLEGISSRMSQLELFCCNLDKSIGEMRSDLIRNHAISHSKLTFLEKRLQQPRVIKSTKFSKTRQAIVLRFVAAAAATLAAIVMHTNTDTVFWPTYSCQIKYLNVQAYLYFVIANFIAGIYSLLVLFIPANSLLWRSIVAVDTVMSMLVSAANSAALTEVLLEKRGNKLLGWNSICNSISSFCVRAFAAISVSLLGLFAFLVLLLFSIHNFLNPLLVEDE